MTVETAGPRTSVPDMTDLLERTNPTLPPREEQKLVEAADFVPVYGWKRVVWDKLATRQDAAATMYGILHDVYHLAWVGVPAILLAKYFSGS